MNSTDAQVLKFMSGLPVIYQDICLIKSPTLKQIAAEGLDKFYSYISLLTASKPTTNNEELQALLSPLSNFEYLLLLAELDSDTHALLKAAFKFFTDDNITLLTSNASIILGDPIEKRVLTADNFDGFADLIALSCAMRDPKEETIEFLETDTPQVRALKEKLLKGRQDRKKAKSKASKKNGMDLEISDLIASLAIGGSSYNLTNVWDLTYYAFQDQLKRLSWREEFDINTRASLAGAKLDKNKLSHWIKTMSFN